jgi:isopentenyl diphosphate isomerase/L-lactate dehydrogenase-like FMN-dependent dehydrogenase
MRELHQRRQFLRFLAGSPLLSMPAAGWQALPSAGVITDPKDALNILDFEAAARQTVPPAHFGFLATGVDDEATLKANREGFNHIQLRPRRLIDVSRADLRTELFGTVWDHPIVIAPVASQKAFHPDGELATARAVRSKRALQILSTASTCRIEDVAEAAGRPIWYQLYPTSRWNVTEKLVRRAESAGCPVLVLTVDLPVGRNAEMQKRFERTDSRKCSLCHSGEPAAYFRRKPMFEGIDMAEVTLNNPAMTWESVRRLKALTRMKLVLKGIETNEDAQLSVENGVDGIIVSNHGGRAEESARGTIDCLPEVVDGVQSRIPVLVDGGFRRGTDIFKALALGASAICIGRPYLWGLGAFGQAGVERVLEMLRAELELVMKQCGARTIAEIGRSSIAAAPRL